MNNSPPIPADDCDPESLSVEEAIARILSLVQPVDESELVPVSHSLDRVLANELTSPIAVPGADNSAMDGYAFCSADIKQGEKSALTLMGASFAGKPFADRLEQGACIRIMTGALIPAGADTVVMQENVDILDDGKVAIPAHYQAGQHVRKAGEDIESGSRILPKGQLISAADLGLITSVGISQIPLMRKLRVAHFTTGDELRNPGEPLAAGQIYNSNRFVMQALLQKMGVESLDLGNVPDDPDALREIFRNHRHGQDMIISSGGVSVGEADFVKPVFAELGEIRFWKVAMKPGRPLAFGEIGDALYFGLPGNPVSAMVTFVQFVRPALQKLSGGRVRQPLQFPAKLLTPIKKSRGRREFQRGILTTDEVGTLSVSSTGAQGSGILSSMSRADCFIVLEENVAGVEAGAEVMVQPFVGLF